MLNESVLALHLVDPGEEMRPRPALCVVGRTLVRVLAVGEVEHALEHRDERLREDVVAAEPAGDRAVEGGGRLERARGERAPRLERHVGARAELLEQQLVVGRAADRDDVRVVLRRRAEKRRTADVDLLDRVLPCDIEAADRALEGVQVDADEVERLDPVRAQLSHVLGDVAARQDSAVNGRMQRDDAMPEQLAEPGQLLERRHGDALVREHARGAARRDELDPEARELAREAGDARLVVDGEEGAVDLHAAINSRTTSGSSRCSTAWTRARRVSTVSPGSTGNGHAADHRAGVDPLVHPVHRRSGLRHARGEDVLDRMGAGELGQRRRVRVDDPVPEDLEEARPQELHVAGQHRELDAVVEQPVGERLVALVSARVRRLLEDGGRDACRLRSGERAHAGAVRRDGHDRQAGVDQRLEVRALPADEHPDHASLQTTPSIPGSRRPMTTSSSPTSRAGTTAQYPIPRLNTRRSSASGTS